MRAQIQGLSADTQGPTDFDEAFRARLRDLLVWRRDVRCFRRDPLPAGTLERLIHLACLAPSVGNSQPWRFVVVDDPSRRAGILDTFQRCRDAALARLAKIVHAADIAEDVDTDRFGAALLALGEGGLEAESDDHRLLDRGSFVYDALYAWCLRHPE